MLTTLVIVLFGALFAVRFFFIQGASMKNSLFPGDFVYLDKMGYGARIPPHPVGVPYSDRFYLSSISLPYMRMPGLSGIHRNDVIAFDHPMGPMDVPVDKRDVVMKRCVGLPGDSLAILGGKVWVNGKRSPRSPGVITHFHMKARRDSLTKVVLERHGIDKAIRLSNKGDRIVPLTDEEAEELRQDTAVSFVEAWQGKGSGKSGFFPEHPAYPWQPGRVGPLWVPKSGEKVELDTASLPLYERIIAVYEGHALEVSDSVIRIDGEPRDSYTFEMDYFYVLGDSRPYSRDSRTWGFIPEDHIVGRALFVLYSYDTEGDEGFRWDRSFRWIP